jgi:hypothetical protein
LFGVWFFWWRRGEWVKQLNRDINDIRLLKYWDF